MSIEQITGVDLLKVEGGLAKLAPYDPDAWLKFVLMKSPDDRGFVRIDSGPEHIMTLSRLQDYLREQGEDVAKYQKRGGGFVNIYHPKSRDGKTRLSFYGASDVLGKFDKNLLRQTLDESLDEEKFDYSISK